MLTRIGDQFFDTDDIFHVELFTDDKADVVRAVVELVKGELVKKLEFTGESAKYLRTVLDAYHIWGIKQLQDSTEEAT